MLLYSLRLRAPDPTKIRSSREGVEVEYPNYITEHKFFLDFSLFPTCNLFFQFFRSSYKVGVVITQDSVWLPSPGNEIDIAGRHDSVSREWTIWMWTARSARQVKKQHHLFKLLRKNLTSIGPKKCTPVVSNEPIPCMWHSFWGQIRHYWLICYNASFPASDTVILDPPQSVSETNYPNLLLYHISKTFRSLVRIFLMLALEQ